MGPISVEAADAASSPEQRQIAVTFDEFLRLSELAIARQLETGCSSLEHVAGSLGISERTLQRRLSQCGYCFEQLVDALRQTRALALLRDTRMPLVEVALSLGYSDQTTFSRAFKRWTRLSPGVYRTRNRRKK